VEFDRSKNRTDPIKYSTPSNICSESSKYQRKSCFKNNWPFSSICKNTEIIDEPLDAGNAIETEQKMYDKFY